MKHALYIVGAPGSGKSTLVEELTAGWPVQEHSAPFAYRHYPEPGVIELGRRREDFSGTDALSMTVITKAEPWVQDVFFPEPLLLAEGDRLAIDRFMQALVDGGWQLTIAFLDTPGEVAAERRERRAAELGVDVQDDTWVRGRVTKVNNLADRWDDHVAMISGGPSSLAELAEASPVADALLRGATREGATV